MKLVKIMMVLVCTSFVQNEVTSIAVWVNRRLTNDLYGISTDQHEVCDSDEKINVTILVSENQCVRNQELFNSKFQYM